MADGGASNTVTLSLHSVSGEIIWGPGPCKRSGSIAVLRRLASEALKQPEASVRILHNGNVLQPRDTFAAAEVPDGAELGVVLLSLNMEARHLLRKLREAVWVSIRDDPDKVPECDATAKLSEVAAMCQCTILPEDVLVWLKVLLSCGKLIRDNMEQKYDLDEGCTISCSTLVGTQAQHQPDLLYLAIDSFDEMFMGCSHWGCVMVDLRGKLAEILGGNAMESHGFVWYANLQWDSFSPEAALEQAPSLEMWRKIVDEGSLTSKHGAPRCIAPDVTEFFRLWASRGRPPQFEVRHVPSHETEPDGPPRCCA